MDFASYSEVVAVFRVLFELAQEFLDAALCALFEDAHHVLTPNNRVRMIPFLKWYWKVSLIYLNELSMAASFSQEVVGVPFNA